MLTDANTSRITAFSPPFCVIYRRKYCIFHKYPAKILLPRRAWRIRSGEGVEDLIRGVNRHIIEVTDTGNAYYERALLVIKPEYASAERDLLEREARKVLRSMGVPLLHQKAQPCALLGAAPGRGGPDRRCGHGGDFSPLAKREERTSHLFCDSSI